MAASRENMSIWKSKTKYRFYYLINCLIGRFGKWNKEMVIKDSFTTPYYKYIGCKINGHKWSSKEDSIRYDLGENIICWNCMSYTNRIDIREKNLKKILS